MATLISQFELIFKKQAPIDSVELETVLQAYFLQLTNLEERNYVYNIDFVAQTPSDNDAGSKLDSNTLAILDNPGAPEPGNVFSQLEILPDTNNTYRSPDHIYDIAAEATAKLNVIPQIVPVPGDDTPVGRDIEIRGYVQISLPVLEGEAQSSKPVNIMVTPQNRAAFFTFPSDDTFDGGIIKNQVQATLPTSTGGAVLQVEPDQPEGSPT